MGKKNSPATTRRLFNENETSVRRGKLPGAGEGKLYVRGEIITKSKVEKNRHDDSEVVNRAKRKISRKIEVARKLW